MFTAAAVVSYHSQSMSSCGQGPPDKFAPSRQELAACSEAAEHSVLLCTWCGVKGKYW